MYYESRLYAANARKSLLLRYYDESKQGILLASLLRAYIFLAEEDFNAMDQIWRSKLTELNGQLQYGVNKTLELVDVCLNRVIKQSYNHIETNIFTVRSQSQQRQYLLIRKF